MFCVSDQAQKLDEEEKLCYSLFQSFLGEKHQHEMLEINTSDDSSACFSLVVNSLELFDANIEISQMLVKNPRKILPVFHLSLRDCLRLLARDQSQGALVSPKTNVFVRLSNLPTCPELTRNTVPRSSDIGRLLSITGTVTRVTGVRLVEWEKEFICMKCKHTFKVSSDFEKNYAVEKPSRCPGPNNCSCISFSCLSESEAKPESCRDYQEIKIQELVHNLSVGTIPRGMWVVLEDDLVDSCKPGDDVTVCGVVMRRWKSVRVGAKCDLEIVLQANHVSVHNKRNAGAIVKEEIRNEFEDFWREHSSNPLEGRNHIIASVCPQIFGCYVVKLAVALVLIGGVQRIDPSGTRIRGESHLLLVGDPGTAKSQFLKYASKIVPRSVLTSGNASTSAGLTVTAVKDGSEWQLEAGALVLADGGLCCIDEFNCIRESDRISIHEAMEQQTISVAKAGIVCKLNSRTTIIAATNPKGRYDLEQNLDINIGIGSPLLSRFDLVLVFQDAHSEEWDKVISTFVLERRLSTPSLKCSAETNLWGIEKLQAYVCFVKTLTPVLTPESNRILSKYYTCQRQADTRNSARTTIRLLEGLIRLSQAHARLMFRDKVTVQDAVMAITMMECSMQNAAIIGLVNILHTRFPDDCREEYRRQADLVLTELGMQDLLESEFSS